MNLEAKNIVQKFKDVRLCIQRVQ